MAALGLQRVSSFPRSSLRAFANSLNFSFLVRCPLLHPIRSPAHPGSPFLLGEEVPFFFICLNVSARLRAAKPQFRTPSPRPQPLPRSSPRPPPPPLPTHPPASSPMLNSSNSQGKLERRALQATAALHPALQPSSGWHERSSLKWFPTDPDPDREHDPSSHRKLFSARLPIRPNEIPRDGLLFPTENPETPPFPCLPHPAPFTSHPQLPLQPAAAIPRDSPRPFP